MYLYLHIYIHSRSGESATYICARFASFLESSLAVARGRGWTNGVAPSRYIERILCRMHVEYNIGSRLLLYSAGCAFVCAKNFFFLFYFSAEVLGWLYTLIESGE